MREDQSHAEAIRLIEDAAVSRGSWESALEAIAVATGCRTAQLIGFDPVSGVSFNMMTAMDSEALPEFIRSGGADPMIKSRVRAGFVRGEMDFFDDASFTPELDAMRSPEFADWIERNSIGYARLVNVFREDDCLVGAGVLRDSSQGDMPTEQRKRFDALARTLSNAVKTRIALEGEQERLVASTFETLGKAAFVCASNGRILAISPLAEDMLRRGNWLIAPNGFLVAAHHASSADFAMALADAFDPIAAQPGPGSTVLRDGDGSPLFVRFQPLPATESLRFRRAVLVLPALLDRRVEDLAAVARQVFGFTATEALIAAHIANGAGPRAIARLTGSAESTVRSHLKRIYFKAHVGTQVELAATVMGLA